MRKTSTFTGSMKLVVGGAALAALTMAMLIAAAPRDAKATPAFAQQTGKQCGFCHGKPPELNAQGKKFKANGNKL